MEEIRDEAINKTIRGYTPYWSISREELKDRKWEVVYFLYPDCGGTCAHCWSSETFLGRAMPVGWHEEFWRQADPVKIKEIRLSGGDPFFYKEIGKVIRAIRESVGSEVPILIFTSGKSIVSLKPGKKGVDETVDNILRTGVVSDNVEIHLSADEHHAGSLYRASRGIKSRPTSRGDIESMNELGIPLLQTQVKNFLAACDILVAGGGRFKGGKIKIHAETNRLQYHRQTIFPWLDEEVWKNKIISSEGLIKAGSAKDFDSATELISSSQLSLFIFPGAEFYLEPQTKKAQAYRNPENQDIIYLDRAGSGGYGASIVGWWNIVDRVYCGGSAYDACGLIGK